jgi:hypothetical protein
MAKTAVNLFRVQKTKTPIKTKEHLLSTESENTNAKFSQGFKLAAEYV